MMSGYVFDANVLKHFLTTGLVSELAQLCPGRRHAPITVYSDELAKLRDNFDTLHRDLPLEELTRYSQRLRTYDATLAKHGFTSVNVMAGDDAEAQAFLACQEDEDRIDPGEAECLAIAAYRGDIVYSDDYAFKQEVEAVNSSTSPCPRNPRHVLNGHPLDPTRGCPVG